MFEVDEIRIEHAPAPVITDRKQPRFSFSLKSGRRDVSLRSACIRVNGWEGNADDPLNIIYKGPDLQPLTDYRVEIEAVSDRGERALGETVFTSGRLDLPWKARWISDPDYSVQSAASPAPLAFRRTFRVRSGGGRLRIFTTAMGIFDLYLDGKRLNEDYFAPGFTNYEKDLQYTVNEVPSLSAGRHELTAVVAAGWACGRTTHVDDTTRSRSCLTASRPALLCELRLDFPDGRRSVLGTDGKWEVTGDTPWRFADFYDGEIYDASCSLGTAVWKHAAEEKLRVKPRLSARCGQPVTAHEVFTPVSWQQAPSGEWIADFGQNMAGVLSFTLQGKKGQEIVIRHGEALEKDELYVQNLRSARQEIRYICREGQNTYSPRFTYMGFRYAGVRGAGPDTLDLKAMAVYSDLESIGSFQCSDPDLNRLQSNLTWSGKSNFVDIPTDCPQRDERQGWTGDIALFSPTACFNFDMARFLEKWLRDLSTEQTALGAVPFVVPARKGITPALTTSCWGDSSILVPWALYQENGDRTELLRCYPAMKKYMGDTARWAALSLPFFKSPYILKFPFQFGDWCAPYGGLPDWLAKGPWVGTAYYYRSCLLMSDIAAVLGKDRDSRRYAARAGKIRDAFRRVFTDGNGRMKEEFQTAYVLALAFGLAEEGEADVMAERLCLLIREAGGHLNTGFTATPFLLFALCDSGHEKEAFDLLLQRSAPSWLCQIRRGATTLWENWESIHEDGSIQESSLNHYAYGAVGDFFYRRICGLVALEAGWRSFQVKPVPDSRLSFAECRHKCPFGLIEVRWEKAGKDFCLRVSVPVGTKCRVVMPGGREHCLGSGEHRLSEPCMEE